MENTLVTTGTNDVDGAIDTDNNTEGSQVATGAEPKVINVDEAGDKLATMLADHRANSNKVISDLVASIPVVTSQARATERELFLQLWTHTHASEVATFDVDGKKLAETLASARKALDAITPQAELVRLVQANPTMRKMLAVKLDDKAILAQYDKALASVESASVALIAHESSDPRTNLTIPTEIAITRTGTSSGSRARNNGTGTSATVYAEGISKDSGSYDCVYTFICPSTLRMDVSTKSGFVKVDGAAPDTYTLDVKVSTGMGNARYYLGAAIARTLGYPDNKNGNMRTPEQQANLDAIRAACGDSPTSCKRIANS